MVQLRTILKPADNAGAKRLRVIHVHGGSKRRFGHIGDIVTARIHPVAGISRTVTCLAVRSY